MPALPWLVMATAIRIVAYGKPGLILPAMVLAGACVLLAFFATARDSIQASGGRSSLGELTLAEQIRLSLSILWRIVLVRMGTDEATRKYLARRMTEGKTKAETMRCLKRYVAREVYNALPKLAAG